MPSAAAGGSISIAASWRGDWVAAAAPWDAHLRELQSAGVCELLAAPNQHRRSRLEVRDAWWPYERTREEPGHPAEERSAERAYVDRVRQLFAGASCVQGMFTPSDARLAAAWHARGIAFETVRRAWLLGCTRKSFSLIDRPLRSADPEPALLRPVAGGSARRGLPARLLDAPAVQPRALRATLASQPPKPRRALPGRICNSQPPRPAAADHHERSNKTR